MNSTISHQTFTYSGAEARTALCGDQLHCIITPSCGLRFEDQLAAVCESERHLADYFRMSPVFKRYFLSDIVNQASLLPEIEPCAVSVIQQPPLCGSKVVLWIVMERGADFQLQPDGVWEDSRGRIIQGDTPVSAPDSAAETREYLTRFAAALSARGGNLRDNCLRTWFMVHDVDHNYGGIVRGRNEIFAEEGLKDHFIASTGIGGSPAASLVAFNAVADLSVKPEQINFIKGGSHLNPTIEYGVAFERATAVDYPDYRKVYVSGTASIDNKGQVVAVGDIEKQTERMIENIEVLLHEADCGLEDVMNLIVYLRDIADYEAVDSIFEYRLPGVPRVLLLAPVCRPQWLVETECIAIRPKDATR
ncbi:MAG: hypothetical protein K2K82_01855 [Muribaculaceae bacterium]|nr:hypothetical protein [Muribaculaceae bacterium]